VRTEAGCVASLPDRQPTDLSRLQAERPPESSLLATAETARAPQGWLEFCSRHAEDCSADAVAPSRSENWDVVVTINRIVNRTVQPMSDLEHWGAQERWSYPDDGFGDCEDYALLKRQLLMQIGWSRENLLLTLVRDRRGEGHAVLMVRTSAGDLILDNQTDQILPWAKTGYHFVKRQSQVDPQTWVWLDEFPSPLVMAKSR
jgi:predicted transglutaminase-like cysteine proteinase